MKKTNPYKFLGIIIKKVEAFRIALVLGNLFLAVLVGIQRIQINEQTKQIQTLTVTKVYLLAQQREGSKAINETPLAWWKKEYFPEEHRIIMVDYNDAFYDYILKPIGLSRYDYVRQPDSKFFPTETSEVFFKEDFEVLSKYLAQPLDSLGGRPFYSEEFGNHWVDTSGKINKDGYWRFAQMENGHYYIYGILKRPIPSKKIKVVRVIDDYLKPKSIRENEILYAKNKEV